MGRRSVHTADELRELILKESTELIVASGFAGLSAREIARRIDYSPGTLYNVFENLDDLVMTIEGRLLDRLAAAIGEVPADGDPTERVRLLAARYMQFTQDNPKLWNLLFEHHLPPGRRAPDWYLQKIEGLMRQLEAVLSPLMPDADEAERKRSAQTLWAGVHGITSLATADKLSAITTDTAGALLEHLVNTYLAGLDGQRGDRKPNGA